MARAHLPGDRRLIWTIAAGRRSVRWEQFAQRCVLVKMEQVVGTERLYSPMCQNRKNVREFRPHFRS
jgi:hypothetical protein